MSKKVLVFNDIQELGKTILIREPPSPYFDCGRYEEDAVNIKPSLSSYRIMFYQIALYTKGTMHLQVNETDYTISSPTLFLCAPGTVLSYDIQEKLKGCYLLFSPGFLAPSLVKSEGLHDFAFFSPGNGFVCSLNAGQVDTLMNIFEKIQEEKKETTLMAFDIINCYITILILQACRIYERLKSFPGAPDTKTTLIKKFQDLIALHLQEVASGKSQGLKSVSHYAESLHIHPNYLNEIAKKFLGKSANSFIQEKVILEALTLLRQTDLNIKEVAYRLGFDSSTHFSHFFKKKTNFTPSEYKKLYNL